MSSQGQHGGQTVTQEKSQNYVIGGPRASIGQASGSRGFLVSATSGIPVPTAPQPPGFGAPIPSPVATPAPSPTTVSPSPVTLQANAAPTATQSPIDIADEAQSIISNSPSGSSGVLGSFQLPLLDVLTGKGTSVTVQVSRDPLGNVSYLFPGNVGFQQISLGNTVQANAASIVTTAPGGQPPVVSYNINLNGKPYTVTGFGVSLSNLATPTETLSGAQFGTLVGSTSALYTANLGTIFTVSSTPPQIAYTYNPATGGQVGNVISGGTPQVEILGSNGQPFAVAGAVPPQFIAETLQGNFSGQQTFQPSSLRTPIYQSPTQLITDINSALGGNNSPIYPTGYNQGTIIAINPVTGFPQAYVEPSNVAQAYQAYRNAVGGFPLPSSFITGEYANQGFGNQPATGDLAQAILNFGGAQVQQIAFQAAVNNLLGVTNAAPGTIGYPTPNQSGPLAGLYSIDVNGTYYNFNNPQVAQQFAIDVAQGNLPATGVFQVPISTPVGVNSPAGPTLTFLAQGQAQQYIVQQAVSTIQAGSNSVQGNYVTANVGGTLYQFQNAQAAPGIIAELVYGTGSPATIAGLTFGSQQAAQTYGQQQITNILGGVYGKSVPASQLASELQVYGVDTSNLTSLGNQSVTTIYGSPSSSGSATFQVIPYFSSSNLVSSPTSIGVAGGILVAPGGAAGAGADSSLRLARQNQQELGPVATISNPNAVSLNVNGQNLLFQNTEQAQAVISELNQGNYSGLVTALGYTFASSSAAQPFLTGVQSAETTAQTNYANQQLGLIQAEIKGLGSSPSLSQLQGLPGVTGAAYGTPQYENLTEVVSTQYGTITLTVPSPQLQAQQQQAARDELSTISAQAQVIGASNPTAIAAIPGVTGVSQGSLLNGPTNAVVTTITTTTGTITLTGQIGSGSSNPIVSGYLTPGIKTTEEYLGNIAGLTVSALTPVYTALGGKSQAQITAGLAPSTTPAPSTTSPLIAGLTSLYTALGGKPYSQVIAPGVPGSQGPALVSGGPAFSGQPSPQFKALQGGAATVFNTVASGIGYAVGVPELTIANAFGANLTNSSTLGKVGGLRIYAPTPAVAKSAGTLGLEAAAIAGSVIILPELGIGTVASLAGVGAVNVGITAALSPQGIGVISPQQALTAFATGEAFAAGISIAGGLISELGASAGPLTSAVTGRTGATAYTLSRTGATLVYSGISAGLGYVTSGGNLQATGEAAVVGGIFGATSPELSRVPGLLSGAARKVGGFLEDFPVSSPDYVPTETISNADQIAGRYIPQEPDLGLAGPPPSASAEVGFTTEQESELAGQNAVRPDIGPLKPLSIDQATIAPGSNPYVLSDQPITPDEFTQLSAENAAQEGVDLSMPGREFTNAQVDQILNQNLSQPYMKGAFRPLSSPISGQLPDEGEILPSSPPKPGSPGSAGAATKTVLPAVSQEPYITGVGVGQIDYSAGGFSFLGGNVISPALAKRKAQSITTETTYLTTPASATSPLVNFMASVKSRPVSIQTPGSLNTNALVNATGYQHDPTVTSIVSTSTKLLDTTIPSRTLILGNQPQARANLLSLVSGVASISGPGTGLLSTLGLGLGSSSITSLISQQTQTQQSQTQQSQQQQQEEGLLAFPFVSFIPATTSAERGGGVPENYLPYPPMQQKKRRMKLRRGKFVDVTIRNQVSENVLGAFGEFGYDLLGSDFGDLNYLIGFGGGKTKGRKRVKKRRG